MDGKSLKQWRMEQAEKLGISEGAFRERLYRGAFPYPKVVRINRRVVLVIEETEKVDRQKRF